MRKCHHHRQMFRFQPINRRFKLESNSNELQEIHVFSHVKIRHFAELIIRHFARAFRQLFFST